MPNNDFAPHLGPKIAAALERRGKNQKQLAEEVGVQPPTISMLVRGKADPSLDLLRRIGEALDLLTVVDLVDFHAAERTYTGPLVVTEMARQVETLPEELRHLVARFAVVAACLPDSHIQVLTEQIGSWEGRYLAPRRLRQE